MGDRQSVREAQRLETRERLLTAAVSEFKRVGMGRADVGSIVAAAGVAHGTFFFHFPTKEHVMLELERREEQRLAAQLARALKTKTGLRSVLVEVMRIILGMERRLGHQLFRDFLAVHFSPTRPTSESGQDHPLILLLAENIERAKAAGETHPDVVPINSAVFYLLGLYSLLITMSEWTTRKEMLEDYVAKSLRSMQP